MARTNSVVFNVEVQGDGSLKDLASNLERVEVSAEDTRGELFRLSSGLGGNFKKAAGGVDQLAQSQRNLRRSTSNANQTLFTAGDAIQDTAIAFQQGASAGDALANAARFAGNNVAFGAEQIALLVQQTGSAAGAANALKTSLLGIGGAIVGVQVAVSLLPQLISLLDSAGQEAKAFQEAINDTDLVTFTGELERLSQLEFNVPTDQIEDFVENSRTALSQVEENIEAVNLLRQVASGASSGGLGVGVVATDDRVQAVAQLLGISKEQARVNLTNQEAAKNTLSVLEDQGRTAQDLKQVQTALTNQISEGEAALRRRNALQIQSETLSENEAANQKETVEQLEARVSKTEDLVQLESELKAAVDAGTISLQEAAKLYADLSEQGENLTPPVVQPEVEPPEQPSNPFKIPAVIEFLNLRQLERGFDAESRFDGVEPPPIDTGPLDEADQAALQFAQRLRAIQEDYESIQREADAGLLNPLEVAQAEVRNLEGELIALLDEGVSPASEGFQEVVEQLEQAQTRAIALGEAIRAAGQLGQGIGEAISFTILGDQRAENRLREEQARLQEQLASTDNPDRRARIQKDLKAINTELQRFATLQGRIVEGFTQLGETATNVLRGIIRDLTAAVAQAVILKGVFSLFNIASGGVGSIFKGLVLGGGFSGGGAVSGAGTGTSDSILARLSDGEFVINAASTSAAPQLVQAINSDPQVAKGLNQIVLGGGFASGGFASLSASTLSAPRVNMGRNRGGMNLTVQVTGDITGDVEQLRLALDKNAQLKQA